MSVLWSSKNPIYVLLKSSSQKYWDPCCQNDSFKCLLTSKCIPRIPRDRSTFDYQSRKWVSGNTVVWTRTSSHPVVGLFWERRKRKELKMFIVQLFICTQLTLLNAQVAEQIHFFLVAKKYTLCGDVTFVRDNWYFCDKIYFLFAQQDVFCDWNDFYHTW